MIATLNPAQREVVKRLPFLERAFVGHAVHNQTFRTLEHLRKGDFSYNSSKDPDFTHKRTGRQVELTTTKQLFPHFMKWKKDIRYAHASYATYDMPAKGS